MNRKFLKKSLLLAFSAILPAVYCLYSSTGFQWEPVIRLAGGVMLAGTVALTAALPWPRKWRMFTGGLLGIFWVFWGLAEAVSFQHSGNTFDLKYLHHFSFCEKN